MVVPVHPHSRMELVKSFLAILTLPYFPWSGVMLCWDLCFLSMCHVRRLPPSAQVKTQLTYTYQKCGAFDWVVGWIRCRRLNCGEMWEGGEVACSGVACARRLFQLNWIKIHVGIVIRSRVKDGAYLSFSNVWFLRYCGMFFLLPAQKNYCRDLDFWRGHLGVLKPRPIR